jgi:hypothetical protein
LEVTVSYVRCSILGITTGGEVWSINPVFDPSGEWGDTVNQANLDSAATAIAALSPGTALLGALSLLMGVSGCKLEVRNDADDSLIGISVQPRTTALMGSGTPRMPPQSAMVHSLRTDTPGGSGRGRLYWPCLGLTLANSGRIDPTVYPSNVTAMRVYLTAMRDALATAFPTIGFNLAVRSKTTKTTPHVVRIQGGDVVDTQRRRRDNLPEAYSSLSFP